MVWSSRVLSMAALLLSAPFAAHALGTAANSSLTNTAQVTYTVAAVSLTAASNTATVTVAEILDVDVTLVSPTVSVAPGDTQQELVFTVTNTGNGTEAFSLAALSAAIPGDDFDPVLAIPAIYFDTDGSGDLSAPDVVYVAGSNDPNLAADAPVRIIVVNNIPVAVVNGNRGRSQLSAGARTGTGAPGTTFAGLGDGGVDAVAGASGADDLLFGEYLVAGLSVAANKSQTITDLSGGSRAVAGARINYQVVVSTTGAGSAASTTFSDLIPTNTTYVPGSLTLNSAALSDAADADAGEYNATPTAQVGVTLGSLTQASGPQTIAFAVTIN